MQRHTHPVDIFKWHSIHEVLSEHVIIYLREGKVVGTFPQVISSKIVINLTLNASKKKTCYHH